MTTTPLLGAHLSIAGGVWKAVERAVDLGCTALQIFTQSPGRWQGPPITEEAAERFRSLAAEAGLDGVTVVHTPYLINVAAPAEALWERSIGLLTEQLRRAELLGLAGVVHHPGAHTGSGVETGIERAAEGMRRALDAVPGSPPILIEVTAGQGTVLGSTMEEVGALLDRLPAGRAGVCWDTAHLWGAGFDIVGEAGWEALWTAFQEATGRTGPDAVHLNDTNVELGSHRDRHARIGHGALGEATFARIVTDSRLTNVPMVLETPKGPDEVSWDREALALLRRLAG